MYPVSAEWMQALTGSYSIRCRASAYLGADLIADDLPIGAGATVTSTWEGKATRHSLSLPVVDEMADLFRLSMSAPLAPFGQRIVVRGEMYLSDTWSESVPFTPFRISKSDPGDERWRLVQPVKAGREGVWVPAGRVGSVAGDDMLEVIVADRLLADEKPLWRAGVPPSVKSESVRLIGGALPQGAWAGATVVRDALTFHDDRLDALYTLAQIEGRVPHVDRDGSYLPLQPLVKTTPDWEINYADEVIAYHPSSAVEGVRNIYMVTGEDPKQKPVTGTAFIDSGPLSYKGPFGRASEKEQSSVYTTNLSCLQAAQRKLAANVTKSTVPVEVTCKPNLALDVLDTVRIGLPPARTMTGLATSITYPLDGGSLMKVTVAVPWDQVWTA